MTLAPIVERELRVRARQKATFWVRFGAALGGVLICFLLTSRYAVMADSAELGSALFGSLGLAAYLICCAAFVLTADVISVERREKTLGLLFLTHIKGLDVLIGKTLSSSILAISALAGYLPILMLPVVLGGVTGGEAVRNGLVIANQLFAGIAAGVWASSRGADWFANAAKALAISLVLIPLSAVALNLAAATTYPGKETIFWLLTGLQHLATWLLLLSAWRRLRDSLKTGERVRVTKPATFKPRTMPPRRRRERLGDDLNPIEWCVQHERGVLGAFWIAGILLLARNVISLGMYEITRSSGGTPFGWSAWILLLALELAAFALQAWAAARFFMATRHTGELEVLLSTPLGAGAVITGQWRALRRKMRGPVLFSLAPVMLHAAGCLSWTLLDWRNGSGWPALWLDAARILKGLFSVVAVCWVGMWFALKAPRPAAAVARTVGWVAGPPLLFNLLLPAFYAYARGGGLAWMVGFDLSGLFYGLPIVWPVLLVLWARKRLQTDLHGIARVRFGVRSDWAELREFWQQRRSPAQLYPA